MARAREDPPVTPAVAASRPVERRHRRYVPARGRDHGAGRDQPDRRRTRQVHRRPSRRYGHEGKLTALVRFLEDHEELVEGALWVYGHTDLGDYYRGALS